MGIDRRSNGRVRRAIAAGVGIASMLGIAGVGVAAGGGGGKPKGPSPVEVLHERPETDLPRVKLVPRASERLGVRTAQVEYRVVPRTRTYGGVVMTPPGRVLKVVSPGDGTVLAASGGGLALPGSQVEKGQALLKLLVVSPAEAAQARDVVEVAAARLAVAEAEVARRGEAARPELERARRSLDAARRRQRLLTSGSGENADRLAPVVVTAPFAAIVSSLAVSIGQSVSVGSVLVELVQIDPVWVRTPVFSGDLTALDPDAEARVRRFGAKDWRAATPTVGPPTADPATSSIDRFYSLPNPGGQLLPGERVEVTLALGSSRPAVVLPFAAVVYDIHGATWVYEVVEPDVYVRRRVEIDFVSEGEAVARSGPAEGAEIVTDGAAELFGAEFGIGR